MAYSTITSLSANAPSCKEQHENYAAEKARVSALAAELGPVAENCHKLHGEYETATAKRIAAETAKAQCKAKLAKWSASSSAYAAYSKSARNCQAYLKAKKAWADLVAKLKAKNYAISMSNNSANVYYNRDLAIWKRKRDSYLAYRAAISAQAYSVSQQWANTLRARPHLANYQWNYRTRRCNIDMQCMSKQKKIDLTSSCVVVRGLGETKPVASLCLVRSYYPDCPTSNCPTAVADPGPQPTAPIKTPLLPIPTLAEYLASKKISPDSDDCSSRPVVPAPGTKPSCNPSPTLPGIPPKPTCVAPDIPPMPVSPTCKVGIFGQIGPMWLVLAAGAGGLYWYSKKK